MSQLSIGTVAEAMVARGITALATADDKEETEAARCTPPA